MRNSIYHVRIADETRFAGDSTRSCCWRWPRRWRRSSSWPFPRAASSRSRRPASKASSCSSNSTRRSATGSRASRRVGRVACPKSARRRGFAPRGKNEGNSERLREELRNLRAAAAADCPRPRAQSPRPSDLRHAARKQPARRAGAVLLGANSEPRARQAHRQPASTSSRVEPTILVIREIRSCPEQFARRLPAGERFAVVAVRRRAQLQVSTHILTPSPSSSTRIKSS